MACVDRFLARVTDTLEYKSGTRIYTEYTCGAAQLFALTINVLQEIASKLLALRAFRSV
jgi:hypothetical protein